MKLKCLATIAAVYLQSNEESVEGDERILKAPVMESRETRAQSHIRNDLISGNKLNAPIRDQEIYRSSFIDKTRSSKKIALMVRRVYVLGCSAEASLKWKMLLFFTVGIVFMR